jgi:methionyl-tRNA synthetase
MLSRINVTVLGGPDAVARGTGKAAFWAASNHLVGKDILRQHAVYWRRCSGAPACRRRDRSSVTAS